MFDVLLYESVNIYICENTSHRKLEFCENRNSGWRVYIDAECLWDCETWLMTQWILMSTLQLVSIHNENYRDTFCFPFGPESVVCLYIIRGVCLDVIDSVQTTSSWWVKGQIHYAWDSVVCFTVTHTLFIYTEKRESELATLWWYVFVSFTSNGCYCWL